MNITHPWFSMFNSPRKTTKRGQNQLISRSLILELLEERAAPGDLLGVGLTQAAMFTAARPTSVPASITTPPSKSPATAPNSSLNTPVSYGIVTSGLTAPSRQSPVQQSTPALSPTNSDPWNAFGSPSTSGGNMGGSSLPSGSQSAIGVGAGLIGSGSATGGNSGIQGNSLPPSTSGSIVASPVIGILPVTPPSNSPTPVPPIGSNPGTGAPGTQPVTSPVSTITFTGISPDTGSSSTDRITLAKRPAILGTAPVGMQVQVISNGQIIGTGAANASSQFSAPLTLNLIDGFHQFQLRGMRSGVQVASANASLTVDSVAPQISITATPAVTAGKSLQVTASSSDGGILALDVDLNRDGAYSGSELSYKSLSSGSTITLSQVTLEGTYKIRARQTDVAGNMGSAEESSVVDPYAGFVGDSQLKAMVQPVLRELGYTAKWDGKAVTIPAGYRPADAKLAEPVVISVRCIAPQLFGDFQKQLSDMGMEVNAVQDRDLMVDGSIPLFKVLRLPSINGFSTASYVAAALSRVGSAQNEGVPVMKIPQFQQLTGAIGTGVTVGVISDSANAIGTGVAGSIASGDLPANTTVLYDDSTGSDEGRAMMELIYDAAPGVNLAFSSRGPTPLTFANSVINLAAYGCEVITDDIVFFSQPMFNDGRVSQAVETVNSAGVVYTSAFGNDQDWGWVGDWRSTQARIGTGANTVTGTFLTFSSSDYLQNMTIANGDTVNLAFQWDSAYLEGGSTLPNYQVRNDLDLYLIDLSTGTIVASALTINQNTDQAYEQLGYTNASTNTSFALAVNLYSGAAPSHLAWINYGDNVTAQGQGATTTQGTPTARNAIGVAAANWQTPSIPESFTSLGGLLPFYFDTYTGARLATPDLRQKPDITAPDGVTTSVPGFAPFFGTSAAAPQVAAAAALLLSSAPTVTNDQIFFHLLTTARNIYSPGSANLVGAGMTTLAVINPVTPGDASGDELNPTNLGTVGRSNLIVQNQSIGRLNGVPDVDWFIVRASVNGTFNINFLNGPSGSLELRLFTLGPRVNLVERARSVAPGLLNRQLAINVTANQLVYIKVNGRASTAGNADQALYQFRLNIS
jgi:hypothetical protein